MSPLGRVALLALAALAVAVALPPTTATPVDTETAVSHVMAKVADGVATITDKLDAEVREMWLVDWQAFFIFGGGQ